MSNEKRSVRFDAQAFESLMAKALEEIGSAADIESLNACRAAFRKAVPLYKRAYVAAWLASSLLQGGNESRRRDGGRKEQGRGDRPKRLETQQGRDQNARKPKEPREPREAQAPREPKPKHVLQGETATIFFGIGRNQRFHARVVLAKLIDVGGLDENEVGEIRCFDNYTFVTIVASKADGVITAFEGAEHRGRKLVVNFARDRALRDETADSDETRTDDEYSRYETGSDSYADEPGNETEGKPVTRREDGYDSTDGSTSREEGLEAEDDDGLDKVGPEEDETEPEVKE